MAYCVGFINDEFHLSRNIYKTKEAAIEAAKKIKLVTVPFNYGDDSCDRPYGCLFMIEDGEYSPICLCGSGLDLVNLLQSSVQVRLANLTSSEKEINCGSHGNVHALEVEPTDEIVWTYLMKMEE